LKELADNAHVPDLAQARVAVAIKSKNAAIDTFYLYVLRPALPQEYGAKTAGWRMAVTVLLSFHCCVARTRFVHLSFRLKSAFAKTV
jgi:hypothetical protein